LLAHLLCKDEGTESIRLCWKIGVYYEVLISGHLEFLFIGAERSSSGVGQSASGGPVLSTRNIPATVRSSFGTDHIPQFYFRQRWALSDFGCGSGRGNQSS